MHKEKLGQALINRRFGQKNIKKENKTPFSVVDQANIDRLFEKLEISKKDISALNSRNIQEERTEDPLDLIYKRCVDVFPLNLSIPPRVNFTEKISITDFQDLEKRIFNKWKDEHKNVIFERNLEIWRQFWITCEKSDVIVQIIDCRNILFFFNKDIINLYPKKKHLIVLNKSDLIKNTEQIEIQIKMLIEEYSKEYHKENSRENSKENKENYKELSKEYNKELSKDEFAKDKYSTEENIKEYITVNHTTDKYTTVNHTKKEDIKSPSNEIPNVQWLVFSCQNNKYLEDLKNIFIKYNETGNSTFGMIGYPNVGKSSSINTLLQIKKVGVSKTPGKTKRLQSLNFNLNNIKFTLLDCPGLIFPTHQKTSLILNSILNVDQMKDLIKFSNQIIQHFGIKRLCKFYNINEFKNDSRYDINTNFFNQMIKIKNIDFGKCIKKIVKDFIDNKLTLEIEEQDIDLTINYDWYGFGDKSKSKEIKKGKKVYKKIRRHIILGK
ncbi:large ribosome-binding GTPase [Hamiltosporidium tvaerminnensis]|uniref:Large ribosome-binding GTPase n=1 Tax=Hamiltosporidium tvaerminnensis TaxID=1176355 RepID=A0A4Q9KUB3_9MICR|nr:large ribosome-binding GTPase [Hamiltosporidium tvaerminnensis]